jgi:hypothetical protein
VLNDGDYEDPSRLPKEERERLGHRFRGAAKLLGGLFTSSAFQNSVDRIDASKFVDAILDAVLDKVIAVDTARKAKQDCISALFGTSESLGIIEPTAWPSKDRFEAIVDAIAKSPLNLREPASPNSSPTLKVFANAFSTSNTA